MKAKADFILYFSLFGAIFNALANVRKDLNKTLFCSSPTAKGCA